MNYIGKYFSKFKEFYNEINGATLTGAIDVIVVQQEDGEYVSSPFHVRFGKIGVLRSREKVVDIEINGEPVDIHMKLGETGEAFFVERIEDDETIEDHLGTSPLPSATFYSPNEIHTPTVRRLNFDTEGLDLESTASKSINVPADPRPSHSRSRSFSSTAPVDPALLLIDGDGSRTDNEEVVKSTRCRRKKRRKVSHAKRIMQEGKSKNTDGHSSENSTTSEAADAPYNTGLVFTMEDVNNASEDRTLHSLSAPQLSRKTQSWEAPVDFGPHSHAFSDNDASPPGSRTNSRSITPVKSDTEYEMEKHRNDMELEDAEKLAGTKWSWTWGELPTPPSKVPSVPNNISGLVPDEELSEMPADSAGPTEQEIVAKAQQRSIGNMFSFMRSTRKARHQPEMEGLYLDQIDSQHMDPELVSLYFPKRLDEHQFRPVKDEDIESGNGTSLPQSPHSTVGAIGGPRAAIDSDFEDAHHPLFDYKGYHDVAFSLCGQQDNNSGDFPASLFMQSLVTYDEFVENPHIINDPNLVVRLNNRYLPWTVAAPEIMSLVLFQRELPQTVKDKLSQECLQPKARPRTQSRGYSWFSWGRGSANPGDAKTENSKDPMEPETLAISQSLPDVTSPHTSPTVDTKSSPILPSPILDLDDKKESSGDEDDKNGSKYRKTLRLTSERIKKLNLKHGLNQVTFSVTTAYQGTSRCQCHLFLWNHDEKIVISDIDGTITKSDVLGHVLPSLPIIGQDWAQNGVAELYTRIKNNGYSFLYLSARAIGQAHITRDYLQSIKQDNRTLPEGPLLLNPTSLIQAFHREVIVKKPEEFKISCLKDIQALFKDRNPFYAGFGNRLNDVWAYREVDVPITRIFTINHQGVIKHEHSQTLQTTYTSLSDIVHHMFPSSYEQLIASEFSQAQFWRQSLPDISEELSIVLKPTKKK